MFSLRSIDIKESWRPEWHSVEKFYDASPERDVGTLRHEVRSMKSDLNRTHSGQQAT